MEIGTEGNEMPTYFDHRSDLSEEQLQLILLSLVEETKIAIDNELLFPQLGWLPCLWQSGPTSLDKARERSSFMIFGGVLNPKLGRKGLGVRGVFGPAYSWDLRRGIYLDSGNCYIWGYTATKQWLTGKLKISLKNEVQTPEELTLDYCGFREVLGLIKLGGTPIFVSAIEAFRNTATGILKTIDQNRSSADIYLAKTSRRYFDVERSVIPAGTYKTYQVEIAPAKIRTPSAALSNPYTIHGTNIKGELIISALVQPNEALCAKCAEICPDNSRENDGVAICSRCE